MRTGILAAFAVGLAAGASGCGGDSSGTAAKSPARSTPAPPAGGHPAPGRPGDVGVIRNWADALRAGHPERSARYFAVPSFAQNGTPPLLLRSSAAVLAFNRSLPCGAELLRTRMTGRYVVATFRLTDRPGGQCGQGVGGTAATAFRIQHGRIVEWRRVDVPRQGGALPAPLPSGSSSRSV